MFMAYLITKASGIQQEFDPEKVRTSLKRAGASDDITEQIIQEIERIKPKTTHEIYKIAIALLNKTNRPTAARYNLKQALIELGPAGFPFEQFVAELFKRLGYTIATDQHITGACVEHEVDIVASKDKQNEIIECKFHNQQGLICDVKIPLYVKARFDDIKQAALKNLKVPTIHNAWVVTNTHFSSQAIAYAECMGMKLLDWSYPENNSLSQLIDRYKLHPITALTSINYKQKKELISHGIVLCNDVSNYKNVLANMGMKDLEIEEFISEAQSACGIK
jgi:hypothetical protein